MNKLKLWWHTHGDKVIWRKQIFHDWFTLVDDWGISEDERHVYRIEISMWKVFSLKNGFTYQIQAPNIIINEKKLLNAVGQLLRYLYKGGCPCYFRLEDELMAKGLWRKLG